MCTGTHTLSGGHLTSKGAKRILVAEKKVLLFYAVICRHNTVHKPLHKILKFTRKGVFGWKCLKQVLKGATMKKKRCKTRIGFLSLGTADARAWSLFVGGLSWGCEVFGSIPGLCPLDNTWIFQLSPEVAKCLLGGGQNCALWEQLGYRKRASHEGSRQLGHGAQCSEKREFPRRRISSLKRTEGTSYISRFLSQGLFGRYRARLHLESHPH